MRKAIVLLSGGLDSATTLYMALEEGYECHCLIFDYGQRHKKEVRRAEKIAARAGCDSRTLRLSFPWQGSALLDRGAQLPAGRSTGEMTKEIPSTYVPARNTIFISMAAAWAEAIGAEAVFIGANSLDFSGYPDCRPEYFEDFNRLLKSGTKSGAEGCPVRVEAPLLRKKKGEIVGIGDRLGVPLGLTWSCYEGGRRPCGRCDSCVLRKKGFEEAGLKDPLTEKRGEKKYEAAERG